MNRIPQFIQKNIKNLNKCLEINIGERRGITDYIDFLKKDDFLNNYNVIYGEDYAKRFFISVLYKEVFEKKEMKEKEEKYYNIMTLFQRYTNQPYFFVSCGHTFIYRHDVQYHNFSNTDNPIPKQFEDFFNLINNEQISITYNINDLYDLDDAYFDRDKIIHYELYNKN
jgi:hypothetical protein